MRVEPAKKLGTIDTVMSWPASFLPFPAQEMHGGVGMARGRVGCAFWRAHRGLHSIDGRGLCFMGWMDGRMDVWVDGRVSVDKLRSSVVTYVVL